ncbi:SART-1 family protein DOT2-like [Durio zibethinus]|uniref:SART-1 family protein DOT2-like n=1 Tax=Durio zibethinus TaxID=66656 RepID=A0A6P5WMN2_DURZI|nr:SART-1 family protein DOT2-like [Durio zibethinus]
MEKDRYDREDDASRERWDGGAYIDELEQNDKHQSKDKKKSSREEEKDYRSRDRERDRSKRSSDEVLKEREKESLEKDRVSTRDRRKDDRDEHGKDRSRDSKVREKEKDYDRDKYREKEHEREREKDRRDRGKEKDKERDRVSEKERGKDKGRDRDREKEKEGDKAKEWEKEREKLKDRENKREGDKDRDREKGKERSKHKNREADLEKERSRDRDNTVKINRDEDYEGSSDGEVALDYEEHREKDEAELSAGSNAGVLQASSSELKERIMRMKEERLKKKSEAVSEVSAWVGRSRKLEEKRNAGKEKALQLSKIFEEQDNFIQEENEDEEANNHTTHDLAGVKVLHGLDKVMDGGAVVLTLKDQSILSNGDINEDVDMLENIEIGEQKRRDEAYKAAKKKTGVYDDKFNDEPGSEKKILPQYDDPLVDEGVTLDERGHFTVEAEKKLEELRKRLQGVPTNNRVEDLNNAGKISSDYYTQEEMLRFKKPKKKKALRKKEKLDIDALEAEAISAGLGAGDLGSRNDARRQAIREEEARSEAEKRSNAYQAAYAKADEASKSLRLEQTLIVKPEEDENQVFADDEEDLYKSLERARKLALKKQEKSGPQAVALLATTTASSQTADDQNISTGEAQENKVVITEMEEFVWGLQLEEEAHKPDSEDVFMDEDEVPGASELDRENGENEVGGWTEVVDTSADEKPANEDKDEIVPDETIHEVAVGKGLSGALKLLKDRGTLKEGIDWGGRNMDKKKSKLIGIVDDDRQSDRFKDIRIERTDEFGRIMTPKEAFRIISHKFHGKGPGKMKQEKRMKQYQEELKLKQMKNSDTPSLSVERMREAQAQLKTPYLVLSGHVKPGQTSDPTSGFATVEKDFPGGLTPMLGDRKVEHFLGIKRKAEPGNSSTPKKPKT